MNWGIRSAPQVGAFRPDQRPRACPRFADVASTYVSRFRRMPHRAASVASTMLRSTNFLTGCSSPRGKTVAGIRNGDPSVDALGYIERRPPASSRRAVLITPHSSITVLRTRWDRSFGSCTRWLLARSPRELGPSLQLHRIRTVSRQRSSRSGSPSISDPAASRRFHSNT